MFKSEVKVNILCKIVMLVTNSLLELLMFEYLIAALSSYHTRIIASL
jgi:hypothetical protein